MNKKPEPVSITRISSDQLKDYIDKVNKVVYLCDGMACKRNCKEVGFGMCIRTSQTDHAINKDKGYNSFELRQYYDYKVLEELEDDPVDRWIPFDDNPKSIKFYCSHCQKIVYSGQKGNPRKPLPIKSCEYPYCPYCKTSMKPYIQIAEPRRSRNG